MPPKPATRLPPLLECVPNVSAGRDADLVEALTGVILGVEGVDLLHRDRGVDADRTVFTFAGPPAPVTEAARRLARAARDRIDLRAYAGTHPFVGALDVCPFVPLFGLSPKHALQAAQELARYSAHELGVPVYLYEHSATRPRYRSLAAVRRGGLAAVAARAGELGPDLGAEAHPTAGVTVTGARDLLVAFNVNLADDDPALAREVARRIRTAGPPRRAGALPALRAIGWRQEAMGRAQVSCNLLDYRRAGLGEVYAAVRREARALGSDAAGSEPIGLVPADALTHSLTALGAEASGDVEVDVARAGALLGLGAVRPWVPEERVLEWVVAGRVR